MIRSKFQISWSMGFSGKMIEAVEQQVQNLAFKFISAHSKPLDISSDKSAPCSFAINNEYSLIAISVGDVLSLVYIADMVESAKLANFNVDQSYRKIVGCPGIVKNVSFSDTRLFFTCGSDLYRLDLGKINRALFTISENDILYKSNGQIEYICVKNSFVIIGDSNGHLELINDNTSVGSVTGNFVSWNTAGDKFVTFDKTVQILDVNLNIKKSFELPSNYQVIGINWMNDCFFIYTWNKEDESFHNLLVDLDGKIISFYKPFISNNSEDSIKCIFENLPGKLEGSVESYNDLCFYGNSLNSEIFISFFSGPKDFESLKVAYIPKEEDQIILPDDPDTGEPMLIVDFKLAFTYTQPYFPNPEDCEQRVLTPLLWILTNTNSLLCYRIYKKDFVSGETFVHEPKFLAELGPNVSSGNEENILTDTGLESPSNKELVAEVLADNIEDKIPLKDFTLSSKESDSSVQLPSAPSTGNLASSETSFTSIDNLRPSKATLPSTGNLVTSEASSPSIDNLVSSEATIPSIGNLVSPEAPPLSITQPESDYQVTTEAIVPSPPVEPKVTEESIGLLLDELKDELQNMAIKSPQQSVPFLLGAAKFNFEKDLQNLVSKSNLLLYILNNLSSNFNEIDDFYGFVCKIESSLKSFQLTIADLRQQTEQLARKRGTKLKSKRVFTFEDESILNDEVTELSSIFSSISLDRAFLDEDLVKQMDCMKLSSLKKVANLVPIESTLQKGNNGLNVRKSYQKEESKSPVLSQSFSQPSGSSVQSFNLLESMSKLSNDNVPSSSIPPFNTSPPSLSGTSRSNLSEKSEPSVLQPSLASTSQSDSSQPNLSTTSQPVFPLKSPSTPQGFKQGTQSVPAPNPTLFNSPVKPAQSFQAFSSTSSSQSLNTTASPFKTDIGSGFGTIFSTDKPGTNLFTSFQSDSKQKESAELGFNIKPDTTESIGEQSLLNNTSVPTGVVQNEAVPQQFGSVTSLQPSNMSNFNFNPPVSSTNIPSEVPAFTPTNSVFGSSSAPTNSAFGSTSALGNSSFGSASAIGNSSFGSASTIGNAPFGSSATGSAPFGSTTTGNVPFGSIPTANAFGNIPAAPNQSFASSNTTSPFGQINSSQSTSNQPHNPQPGSKSFTNFRF